MFIHARLFCFRYSRHISKPYCLNIYNARYPIRSLKNIFNIFRDYVDIKGDGIGKGEIATIMGVTDSTSGGQAEKDILIKGKIYDVKDLAGGEFRTASGGYIHVSEFKQNFHRKINVNHMAI